jgi:cullin 3
LIKSKFPELIASSKGVHYMIDNDLAEELKLVYELEARIDSQKTNLTKAIQAKISMQGLDINRASNAASTAQIQTSSGSAEAAGSGGDKAKSPANQQTLAALKWVEDVLQLKDKYDNILVRAFNSDQQLQSAIGVSFRDFINSIHFTRSTEYISLFIDDNMKKGIKDKTEEEIDQVLDKAITLIRYVQDKDMFERYYKKHLSRRLLMNKSISNDVEKQLLLKMKTEHGHNFTAKFEAMFRDMITSEELTSGYQKYVAQLGDRDPSRIDLNINVLTTQTWPMDGMMNENEDKPRTVCLYPPEVDRVRLGFERFYHEKHNGRKLTWMSHMGTADLKVFYAKVPGKEGSKDRRYEVNCPTLAMVVLMLFNSVPSSQALSFEEIQARTNIPEHDLVRTLQSVAVAPKTRFLLKQPMSRDIKKTDMFSINDNFTSKFIKIKVSVIAGANKVEAETERADTEEKINTQRGFIIDAAVVRIMKYVFIFRVPSSLSNLFSFI